MMADDFSHVVLANEKMIIDLKERITEIEWPRGWTLNIALSSMVFTSPRRTRVITIGTDRRVVLDVINNQIVKSSTFSCRTVDETWSTAYQALKAFSKGLNV